MLMWFLLQDISKVKVTGLEKSSYKDKVLPAAQSDQSAATKPITFSSETDRVYASPAEQVITIQEQGEPRLEIVRDMLGDVVVWNPWDKKAAGMADFGPEGGWKKMVCVEAGSVGSWVTLEAGDTWEGGQRIIAH